MSPRPVILILAGMALGFLGLILLGCLSLGHDPRGHSAAGPGARATHNENKPSTRSRAGRDSTVNNISFTGTELGLAGGAFLMTVLGWGTTWRNRNQERKAADTLLSCTEDCEDCKAKARRHADRYLHLRAVRRFHPGDRVRLAKAKSL